MGTVLLLRFEHAVNICFKQISLKEAYVEACAMCQYSLDFTFADGANHVYCSDRQSTVGPHGHRALTSMFQVKLVKLVTWI